MAVDHTDSFLSFLLFSKLSVILFQQRVNKDMYFNLKDVYCITSLGGVKRTFVRKIDGIFYSGCESLETSIV